jgi:hypothetical protein
MLRQWVMGSWRFYVAYSLNFKGRWFYEPVDLSTPKDKYNKLRRNVGILLPTDTTS